MNRHMTPGPRALKGGVDYSWCYTRLSKATALQRDPRAGGIRPSPWPRDFGRWADIARRTETLLLFGFPRRAKVTDDTKMARRFLSKKRKKKENTEKKKREEKKTKKEI